MPPRIRRNIASRFRRKGFYAVIYEPLFFNNFIIYTFPHVSKRVKQNKLFVKSYLAAFILPLAFFIDNAGYRGYNKIKNFGVFYEIRVYKRQNS